MLPPKATAVLNNIVQWGQRMGAIGTDVTKAALRVLYDDGEHVPPVVVSTAYNSLISGGAYSELCRGIEVVPNRTPPVLWITGIRNNGTTTGFRTIYSLLNLRNTGVSNLKFTLYDPTGTALATQSVNLGPFEYRQDSLANLFGGTATAVTPDPLAIKVEVPPGTDVQAFVSVIDNLTGDPMMIPAMPPPAGPIFLPAVTYTPGANGTVWRSDLQITNPDSAAPHTWEVRYLPKSGAGPSARSPSLRRPR